MVRRINLQNLDKRYDGYKAIQTETLAIIRIIFRIELKRT